MSNNNRVRHQSNSIKYFTIVIFIISLIHGIIALNKRSDDIFVLDSNTHMPLVLHFNRKTFMDQLKELTQQPFYKNQSLYTTSDSSYECSLHPPKKYDLNPSQMWIGRPEGVTMISYTPDITIRLPDKYFGMFLGYALDHYGLNPAMLMGLAAKESFATAVYKTYDNNYFLVPNEDDKFDCYASNRLGLCTDANFDGPFQVEKGGMVTDMSAFPHRFYIDDLSVPKKDRKPKFWTDNEFHVLENMTAFHDSYTTDFPRAVVLTSLDFHFRHNMVFNLKKYGLREAWDKRSSREQKDSLEFSVAMYTYNRGVYDTQLINMLAECEPDMDPCTDCKLDGYGGHTTDIRKVCKLVDEAPENELYDYTITWENVEYFLEKLESTYPYESVEGIVNEKLDWDVLERDTKLAFDYLQSNRQSVNGDTKAGISFRYDWRALLAVVRMYLPPIEDLLGPTIKNTVEYWGTVVLDDLGPYVDCNDFPTEYSGSAGNGCRCM